MRYYFAICAIYFATPRFFSVLRHCLSIQNQRPPISRLSRLRSPIYLPRPTGHGPFSFLYSVTACSTPAGLGVRHGVQGSEISTRRWQ